MWQYYHKPHLSCKFHWIFFQKIWRFSSSMLIILVIFLDFFIFLCYKETNDLSIKQMKLAIFYFQPTLNRLLSNYRVKLIWDRFFLKYEVGSNWSPPLRRRKTTFKSLSLLGFILLKWNTIKTMIWNIYRPRPHNLNDYHVSNYLTCSTLRGRRT